MSRHQILQTLGTEILAAIPWLAGESSGACVDEEAFGEAKHDDKEWKDGSPYISISQSSRDQIDRLEPRLGDLQEKGECDLLGAYFRMNPRGRIELYRGPLTSCFWHLILQLLDKNQITAWQLSRLAEAWVDKTLEHEKYHHLIDALMVLFGTHPFKDRLLEEALAVACSHQHVSRRGGSWWWDKLPEDLRTSFLDCAYRYSAPGYRDWKKHQGWVWKNSTVSYVIHPNAQQIIEMASGEKFSDVHRMFHSLDMFVETDDTGLFDIKVV